MKWILGEDYKSLKREIEELEDEIHHCWRIIKYPSRNYRGFRTQEVKNSSNPEDAMALVIDMEEELNKKIENLKALRLKIEDIIDSLPAEQRRLLRMRYIRSFTWQQIAQRLYCDESTCRRIHRVVAKSLNQNH